MSREINRRDFLKAAAAAGTVLLAGDVFRNRAFAAVTFSATELLCRPTDSSVTVNVVPSVNGQIYVKYGTSSGSYPGQTPVSPLVGGTPAEVTIQGLAPNTRYYYRMSSSSDGNTWVDRNEHSFQTQRSPGSTFVFTITADSHVNIVLGSAATWTQTMTNVANDHPDFSLDLGDTFAMDYVTTVAGAEQAYLYQRQFFDLVSSSAPIFIVTGNHEQEEAWHLNDTANPAISPPVLGTNARKKFYPNPVPSSFYSGNTDPYPYLSGDGLREDYYAWTWGDALFVVIDPYWYTTTKPYIGNIGGGETSQVGSGNRWDWTLGLQQFNWLKQTLEGSQAKYKFIFAHHMTGGASDYGGRGGAVPAPLVEWGGYNDDGVTWGWDANRPTSQWGSQPVHKIMLDNDVTAFFHGHDHEYAYEKRDGIVYQCLPAAGFSGYGFNSYSVGTYTLKVLPSPGHLRVTVTPAQATVDYVDTSTGKVNYSYAMAANSPTNLALYQPATADSEKTSSGNTAGKGNDGNLSSFWSANDGRLNHWWKVDLGASHRLTGAKVTFQFARNYRYRIDISTDNVNWTTVADRTTTASTAQVRQESFSATAQYVRITYTGLPASTWASHYEFEVDGN